MKMKCPNCGKRAFDISDLPGDKVNVELKCPHCKNVVSIPCTKESTLNTSN